MKLGEPVRFYEGEWFSEGTIITVETDSVVVDFLDWKQRYKLSELRTSYIFYQRVLVTIGPGEVVEDYR
jgi:hypothetical protein